ncbi:hypothetical protein HanRHA438_Chr05g0243361 [Helianthus annuus]|nr:hypothetical protein HanIR_Chr05g0251791 [Helianthus annuus]KAJ0920617.1 hypothetical protein HanRHA438_Chr05g0243361 [Helianthus annuus]
MTLTKLITDVYSSRILTSNRLLINGGKNNHIPVAATNPTVNNLATNSGNRHRPPTKHLFTTISTATHTPWITKNHVISHVGSSRDNS